jgi:2-polyprenyl-6-methoxyphenol hydroxylase-like FAD-dependent oxidoreductase
MSLATDYRHQETHVPQAVRAAAQKFGHAVVIGSGIAGLTAARVLTDFFRQVTVIDRDLLPDPVEFRRGVLQTRHAHRLMPRGQMILEEQFPGLIEELRGRGAVPIEAGKELVVDYDGTWRTARARQNRVSLSSSRPLLESTLYQRLVTLPGVQMMHGYTVARLQTDAFGERVTGVWLQCRRCDAQDVAVTADLVVDASGRNSKAPQWLQDLGYTPPEEWSVDSFVGYATRCYQRPEDTGERIYPN